MRFRLAPVALLSLLAASADAAMLFDVDGDWAAGSFGTTDWADGSFFEEEDPGVAIPNVVGLSLAAADTALMADGFDTGTTTPQCSAEAADEVLGQTPVAGTLVVPPSDVDLVYSSGTPCASATRRAGIRVGIGIGATQ